MYVEKKISLGYFIFLHVLSNQEDHKTDQKKLLQTSWHHFFSYGFVLKCGFPRLTSNFNTYLLGNYILNWPILH